MKNKRTIIISSLVLAFGLFIQQASAQLAPISTPYHTNDSIARECISLTYNIGIGSTDASTGGQVSQLQNYLNAAGYMHYPATGYYGTLTFSAVRQFQAANGIAQVGLIGPLTRARIQQLSCGGNPPPTSTLSLSSMMPNSGQIGTTVTLNGYGFTPDAHVHFGIGVIGSINYLSPSQISFVVPSYVGPYCAPGSLCPQYASQITAPGNYPVSVTTPNASSNSLTFSVTNGSTNNSLSINSLSPTFGEIGTTVTVNGYGFTPNDQIKFGTGAITQINYINQNTISFTIPSYMGQYCAPGQFCTAIAMQVQNGVFPVSVTDGFNTSNALNFTIGYGQNNGTPTISSLSPSSGPTGTLVTVYGSGFDSNSNITFSGPLSVSVRGNYVNSNQLTFTVPTTTNYQCFAYPCNQQSLTRGNYQVTISNSNGNSNSVNFTVTNGLTYGTPTITSITPTSGPIGTRVWVYGTGFLTSNSNYNQSTTVSFSPINTNNGYYPYVNPTVVSNTQLYFDVPSKKSFCATGNGYPCSTPDVELTVPGVYLITVSNSFSSQPATTSNSVQFTVTSGSSYGNLSITGIDASTSLPVYNSGTWTVHVTNQNSGYLHYSVIWGDENQYGGTTTSAPQSVYSNTSSFTHAYQYRGTFTPRFTVTDDYGHTVTSTASVNIY